MSGHLEAEQIEALLTPEAPRSNRATAVRHLLTGCERCAALARQVVRENGYWLIGQQMESLLAGPRTEESYDAVLARLMERIPELMARIGNHKRSRCK